MPTYTSKTLIPWQSPIGQNKDGSYIYEEVMSKAPTAPKLITPIYTPPSIIPTIKSPLWFNWMPPIDKDRMQKLQAPVKDTLKLNKRIDNDIKRTKDLRSHFAYLQDKGELFLNDKQTDYIKRVKEKYPDYENVPDTTLYGKMILADEKLMEKYGNIGEKTFMQRLGTATIWSITDTADAIREWVDAYKDYNIKDGGAMNEWASITAGIGKFVWDVFTNVGANLINIAVPAKGNREGTTSTSELLGRNVSQTLWYVGDFVKTGIDWMAGEGWTEDTINNITDKILNDPDKKKDFDAAMNILNIIPWWFASKTTKALTAKQVLTNIARDAELTIGKKGLLGTATKEAFDAGMNQWISGGLRTGGTTLNEYLKQLPPEKPAGKPALTRTIPEKTVSNYLNLTPTERGNVEKILGWKTTEQYILENNLWGKTKGELTDIFQKQATDSYNWIKEQLKTITERIESKWAKTAIDDMLETFDSLSSLEKDVYKRDIEYLKTLAEQSDYSLSELHALRQAFDKVNTGMYTAKGSVRSGTRAGAEVEVRNMLSGDIQENALKNGIDVKKMNTDLRVALTLKDGLLRSLSQESKNNLVWLQDIGIMGIFSGGEPLTALSLGIGKKFLEGKMPSIAQKLYNLNKTPYENTAVKRGNTIVTGNGSRLFGLSDSMDSRSTAGLPEVATPKSVTPIASSEWKSLAISAENKTMDAKKLLEKFEQLSPEEKAKAKMASPRLATLVEINTEIKDIQEFKGDFGYTPPEILEWMGKKYLTYSQEAKEMIRKWLDKEDLATLQKINRKEAGLPDPIVEEKVVKGEPKELPKKILDIEDEIGMLDDNVGDKSMFIEKYRWNEYADSIYDTVKNMDRFEIEDYAALWKDKAGGWMIPKNESSKQMIDSIDGFADVLWISSDDAIQLVRDGTGNSRYNENLANFRRKYWVAPFQAKKALVKFKKDWEAGKNPSIDDFLYKNDDPIDFNRKSKEEMDIENSKTPFDDVPPVKETPVVEPQVEGKTKPTKTPTEWGDYDKMRWWEYNPDLKKIRDKAKKYELEYEDLDLQILKLQDEWVKVPEDLMKARRDAQKSMRELNGKAEDLFEEIKIKENEAIVTPKSESAKVGEKTVMKSWTTVVKAKQPTEFKIVEDKWTYNLMQKNPNTDKWELSLWNFSQPEEAAKFVPKSATLIDTTPQSKSSLPMAERSSVKYENVPDSVSNAEYKKYNITWRVKINDLLEDKKLGAKKVTALNWMKKNWIKYEDVPDRSSWNWYWYSIKDRFAEIKKNELNEMINFLEWKNKKNIVNKEIIPFADTLYKERKIYIDDVFIEWDFVGEDIFQKWHRDKLAKYIEENYHVLSKYENPQEIVDDIVNNYKNSIQTKYKFWRPYRKISEYPTIVFYKIKNWTLGKDFDYVIEKVSNAKYRHSNTNYDLDRKFLWYTDNDIKSQYTDKPQDFYKIK
jgi:hypothetical protein